jgi:hypothetical protein
LAEGEIYDIIECSDSDGELGLATFSGLIFGKIGQTYEFETSKIYLKDKVISQVHQISPDQYMCAEYSHAGFWLIDRQVLPTEEELKTNKPFGLSKLEDTREGHNSNCTDMRLVPMFDLKTFPYVIARSRFKVDLIDVKNETIHTIVNEMNTANMYNKLECH